MSRYCWKAAMNFIENEHTPKVKIEIVSAHETWSEWATTNLITLKTDYTHFKVQTNPFLLVVYT